MTCTCFQEDLSAFLDRELDDERAALLFHHLGVCTGCRAFHHDLMHLRTVLAAHPAPVISHALDLRVRSIPVAHGWKTFVHSLRHGVSWWQRRLAIPAPAFALLIAMLAISAVTTIALFRNAQRPQENTPAMYIMTLSPIEVRASIPEQEKHVP